MEKLSEIKIVNNMSILDEKYTHEIFDNALIANKAAFPVLLTMDMARLKYLSKMKC
jgi:hypothetical protein